MQTPSDRSGVTAATARSFVYRFIAQAIEYPEQQAWEWMCSREVQNSLRLAVGEAFPHVSLQQQVDAMLKTLSSDHFDSFLSEYHLAFGHTARGSCPLNEIEYGNLKADPLFQPHRLADLAAFYRAFGLELTDDAGERQDHFSIECEFMSILGAKEAYALMEHGEADKAHLCCEAQRTFLKEHLGRWSPAFTNRLVSIVGEGSLGSIAQFTHEFVAMDCKTRSVALGSEDLLLRSIDEAEESICSHCGVQSLLPGSTGAPTEEDL